MIREYRTVHELSGRLMVVKDVIGAAVGDTAQLQLPNGDVLPCEVLEVNGDSTLLMLYKDALGANPSASKVRFTHRPLEVGLSADMLGRVFCARGNPIDNGPQLLPEVYRDLEGSAQNPKARISPKDFIQTGISAIDGLNTLACGQKMSIFSSSGLPHIELATRIAGNAKTAGADAKKFAVVFAAIGATHEEYELILSKLSGSGTLHRLVLFVSLASDPVAERILVPKMALTTAEFLAFEKDMNVLVILSDMTNYCEALREVSISRGKSSDRYGYPSYMYSDLASIYERAGKLSGSSGSITVMPVLTIPGDNLSHPIPAITTAITDGQIVLSRDLYKRGIMPPVDILRSSSHLIEKHIGAFKTREDHATLANQLIAAYSEGKSSVEDISNFGKSALSEHNLLYARFVDGLEKYFIKQKADEYRPIDKTLDLAWELLSTLPKADLKRIPTELITRYMP